MSCKRPHRIRGLGWIAKSAPERKFCQNSLLMVPCVSAEAP